MAYTLNRFEGMLKEFIIDQQSDAHNASSINHNRYNNLKVTMEPAKIAEPHIMITIGISEACFLLSDGSLKNGSIGADTKYVAKWLKKSGITESLMETWNDATNLKDITKVDE